MTNTADLRAAALAATPIWGQVLTQDDGDMQLAFQRLASPDRILGILERVDQLDAESLACGELLAEARQELERKTAALERLTGTFAVWQVRSGMTRKSGTEPWHALLDAYLDARAALEGKPAPSSMTGGVQSEKGRQR